MTDSTEPECPCIERGNAMTEFGVMHSAGCPWLAWFRTPINPGAYDHGDDL